MHKFIKTNLLILLLCVIVISTLTGCKGRISSEDDFDLPEDQTAEEVQPKTTFDDVYVIVYAGGSEGDSVSSVIANGAKEAQKDLGCKVEIIYSGWNPNKMVEQFKESINKKPDAIAFTGHPGDDVMMPLVEKAVKQGIIVTTLNTKLPKVEEKFKDNGMGYVGQDYYKAASDTAKAAIIKSGLKKGDKVLVWGMSDNPGYRGLRTKGALDALKKFGAKVDSINITRDIDTDPQKGLVVLKHYLIKNPDVKLIFVDHGTLTSQIPSFLASSGKKPGDIYVVGSDLSSASAKGVKEGWINLLFDQQLYLQGYIPVLQACLSKKYLMSGFDVDTGAALVDKSNIKTIKPLIEMGLR